MGGCMSSPAKKWEIAIAPPTPRGKERGGTGWQFVRDPVVVETGLINKKKLTLQRTGPGHMFFPGASERGRTTFSNSYNQVKNTCISVYFPGFPKVDYSNSKKGSSHEKNALFLFAIKTTNDDSELFCRPFAEGEQDPVNNHPLLDVVSAPSYFEKIKALFSPSIYKLNSQCDPDVSSIVIHPQGVKSAGEAQPHNEDSTKSIDVKWTSLCRIQRGSDLTLEKLEEMCTAESVVENLQKCIGQFDFSKIEQEPNYWPSARADFGVTFGQKDPEEIKVVSAGSTSGSVGVPDQEQSKDIDQSVSTGSPATETLMPKTEPQNDANCDIISSAVLTCFFLLGLVVAWKYYLSLSTKTRERKQHSPKFPTNNRETITSVAEEVKEPHPEESKNTDSEGVIDSDDGDLDDAN